jgi:hypothetical protein
MLYRETEEVEKQKLGNCGNIRKNNTKRDLKQ